MHKDADNILLEEIVSIEKIREQYIRFLDKINDDRKIETVSSELFNLGLTMYSKDYNFDSLLYNSLSKSVLDEKISLYPEQNDLIEKIVESPALIVSAPTSFGKTFCVFEYVARYTPKNVVFVVPTLALVDEYLRKVINKYKSIFSKYNKYINFNEETKYDYEQYNLFILTHDKTMENSIYKKIDKIDFLVIDEVYKLQKEENNDRVLILNLAYYFLAKKSKKYVLLAPFIGDVLDKDKLYNSPQMYKTNFSPVINDLIIENIEGDEKRNEKIIEVLKKTDKQKTLLYFPRVTDIPKFVNSIIVEKYKKINIRDEETKKFINWVKNEIHEEWYLVKAMERGFLVHNGQLPGNGFRMLQLDLYDNSEEFNFLLCTSTILEGVNMSAKNIIITKAARNDKRFDAFDFYNLVGRTGRLYKHYLGNAYYIKTSTDLDYVKSDAIKSIKFEITDESEDFEFHANNSDKCEEYNEFLKKLNITAEEYKENIGPKYKIKTVKALYDSYLKLKTCLLNELDILKTNNIRTRGFLVEILYRIINNDQKNKFMIKLNSQIINKLINKQRIKLKTIVNDIKVKNAKMDIDYIISTTLRLKNSFIEHEFYSMTKIIMYFMKCEHVDEELINIINQRIVASIDFLYFSDSKSKKILKDLGIYEQDIEKIIKVIGEDKNNVNEILKLIKEVEIPNLNYLSRYIINRL